jgi:hypothetical protein
VSFPDNGEVHARARAVRHVNGLGETRFKNDAHFRCDLKGKLDPLLEEAAMAIGLGEESSRGS